jgi:hypothetical protein
MTSQELQRRTPKDQDFHDHRMLAVTDIGNLSLEKIQFRSSFGFFLVYAPEYRWIDEAAYKVRRKPERV